MFKRLLNLPLNGKSSIFLFGPRGTGKTSWIKANLPNCLYFDLLDFNTYSQFSANPARLQKAIPDWYADWIVIDEIQRIPHLLNEVHRLIESRKYRFLLTGSSARSLRRHGVNLLAGRALRYHMHPLVAQEIGSDFNFVHALEYGLLPVAVSHDNPKKYLETYIQTYLREEVLQEGLTRNISGFNRFLEVASYSQGSILNFSEIAREVGINRQVVANYFDILDDLLLASRIEPFTKKAKRKMIAHQKFYFFDVGVYQFIKPKGPLDLQSENEGAALETLFYQSALAINDYLELDFKIYFWRTVSGQEVDFILYGPNGLYAFEIKHSRQIASKHLRALNAFGQDYPEAKLFVIYLGSQTEYHGNVTAIPFEKALKDLPALLNS